MKWIFYSSISIIWYLLFFFLSLFYSTSAIITSFFTKDPKKIFFWASLWGKTAIRLSLSKVSVEGQENISNPPLVIISNHQSFFDVYTALGFLPMKFLIMSKKEIFDIPLLGSAMKKANFISIDRSNPRNSAKSLIEAIKKIKNNNNVLIYPEGTRSKDPFNPLEYKAGAFAIAKSGGFPIQPVVVYGTHTIQKPGQVFPIYSSHIIMKILPIINTEHELHPSNKNSSLDEKTRLNALQKILLQEFIKLDDRFKKT